MSRFQLIFTGLLVVLGVGGAILFAVSKNQGSQGNAAPVVMWGTVPQTTFNNFLSTLSNDYRDTVNVTYVEKTPTRLEPDLIAALARGQGPDMVLLPQDLITKQVDKFYVVPFGNYSERLFKDSFIPEGELYLMPAQGETAGGIIGFPFLVDPLVMYWNRTMFSNAGVATPPTSWTQFFTMAPSFVTKDGAGSITQGFVAFGATKNVAHAKDVISLLSIQAGTPIVSFSEGRWKSVFDVSNSGLVPAEQAVSFFTEFSNPIKTSYSWNKSLQNDKNLFVGGKLALYFGYASELSSIRAANPNLDFDVAPVPQAGANKMTFGHINAVAILKSSPNIASAFTAAVTLSSAPVQTIWLGQTNYSPVRRDMLATLPGDAYKTVFYQSALMSRGWLDPDGVATDDLFARLVENVTSGRLRISEAVRSASLELDTLLKPAF